VPHVTQNHAVHSQLAMQKDLLFRVTIFVTMYFSGMHFI